MGLDEREPAYGDDARERENSASGQIHAGRDRRTGLGVRSVDQTEIQHLGALVVCHVDIISRVVGAAQGQSPATPETGAGGAVPANWLE